MAALDLSYPSDTLPQGLEYPQPQVPLNLALMQSTPQNLPWDPDEYLSAGYLSNTSSSPGLTEHVRAEYPFEYTPSPDATPNRCIDFDSLRRRTSEPLTTVGLQNQLPTQLPEAYNASHMPDIQLREASRKPKNRRQPVVSKTSTHIRECHNIVEKQYRNRLKIQFERLLAVLPMSKTRTLADREAIPSSGQVLSRGQVLDLARERILELEEEIRIMTGLISNGYTLAS